MSLLFEKGQMYKKRGRALSIFLKPKFIELMEEEKLRSRPMKDREIDKFH